MPSIDPTSLPHPASPPAGRGHYSVEDVARMQAHATRAAEVAPTRNNLPAPPPGDGRDGPSPVRAPTRVRTRDEAPEVELRAVSGRYRGRSASGDLELELRVDVDGARPMRRVSGDFFRTTGGTVTYIGSFVVTTPTLGVAEAEVVIDGEGNYTVPTGSPRLRVKIPRVGALAPPAAAEAQFLTDAGVPGARYVCEFESQAFRRVEFESDFVTDVTPFSSYDTGRLPSGGPARVLNVAAAFAEAGVDMVDTGGADEVEIDWAGANRIWTNRELHAAMQNHFSRWRDEPGWRVWLLAATIHEMGGGLRGIMFDQQGAQRQGCAVFHDVIGGTTDQVVRAQLRTYVHELGHCFNLYHSHMKEFMTPPQPNRLDARSWMHYPDAYRSGSAAGAAAYWAAFPFEFDDLELVHLRHGYRHDVMMGANPFGQGAADIDPRAFADPIEDESGLRVHLRGPASFYLGEPVVVELKLETTDTRGKRVNSRIHPNDGFVQIAIRKPGGRTVLYRPYIQQCAEPEFVTLGTDNPAVYDSAYIGYGKDGLYFDDPGRYELRALYHAADGSQVLSNVLRFRVDTPADADERRIADLFVDDQQGQLLYLLGSDSATLQTGNAAFEEVIDRFGKHPMAVYAKLARGMNASRPFKLIDTSANRVAVRPADHAAAAGLLGEVVQTTTTANPDVDPTADIGVDNITLNMVTRSLIAVQKEAGDMRKARATAKAMTAHFAKPKIPGFVQEAIKQQLADALGDGGAGATT